MGNKKMRFLLKLAFWGMVVLLFVPLGPKENRDNLDVSSPLQALYVTQGAFRDIANICQRQPDICENGRALMTTISGRAKEVANLAYEILSDDDDKSGNASQEHTGSPKT